MTTWDSTTIQMVHFMILMAISSIKMGMMNTEATMMITTNTSNQANNQKRKTEAVKRTCTTRYKMTILSASSKTMMTIVMST